MRSSTLIGLGMVLTACASSAPSYAMPEVKVLTFHDRGIAAQLERIFREDLTRAREVTYSEWRHRGMGHLLELFFLPVKRQL